ncbi:MAG TPA: hypothetical protein VEV64_02100, partial [Rhizomicrobium sp.]|nr:hypothetical protein [Rhizomicrobium sp.]
MVQRLAARLGGVDEDGKIFPRLLLADEIRQPLGTKRSFQRVFFAAFGSQVFVFDVSPCHSFQGFTDQGCGFGVFSQRLAGARHRFRRPRIGITQMHQGRNRIAFRTARRMRDCRNPALVLAMQH